jgi:hypothetical protein
MTKILIAIYLRPLAVLARRACAEGAEKIIPGSTQEIVGGWGASSGRWVAGALQLKITIIKVNKLKFFLN